MGTYKEIKGRKIEALASDPPAPTGGQVWLNTTSSTFKYALSAAAWATKTACPQTSVDGLSAGTATAYLFAGGHTPETTVTHEFDGSSWSTGGAMAAPRYNVGACGTQTACIQAGGVQTYAAVSVSTTYNGSTWSAVNSLAAIVEGNAIVGTSTTAMSIGGAPGYGASEQWTGTCWSAAPALNFPVYAVGAHGDSATSAYTSGGSPTTSPPPAGSGTAGAAMQNFNGTSWSATGALLLQGRWNSKFIGGTSAGIITNGSIAAPAVSQATQTSESWNGTSWSSIAATTASGLNLPNGSTASSSTSHLISHGINPGGQPGGVEVYSNTKTITQS